jgi:hypothetical protein
MQPAVKALEGNCSRVGWYSFFLGVDGEHACRLLCLPRACGEGGAEGACLHAPCAACIGWIACGCIWRSCKDENQVCHNHHSQPVLLVKAWHDHMHPSCSDAQSCCDCSSQAGFVQVSGTDTQDDRAEKWEEALFECQEHFCDDVQMDSNLLFRQTRCTLLLQRCMCLQSSCEIVHLGPNSAPWAMPQTVHLGPCHTCSL